MLPDIISNEGHGVASILAERIEEPESADWQAETWAAVHLRDRSIVIEPRALGELAEIGKALAEQAPFERRGEGAVDAAVAALGQIPPALAQDIRSLALRFAALMGVPAVRLRLEGVTTNACRKVHTDYTDVRLITTYFGPGTDYVPSGGSAEALERISTGHVALFKGRLFGEGHAPCLHRSPPVGDTGERRLVLVIDTPLDEERAELLRATPVGS